MVSTGDLKAAVLATKDGLPIVSIHSAYDTDTTAAIVAFLQRVSKDARLQLGMADVDEVTIYDRDRLRLVSRTVKIANDELILTTGVPPNKSYRRVMNQAMRKIAKML